MRKPRITGSGECTHHFFNRTHNREPIFDDALVADQWEHMLEETADFCGIDLLCQSTMSNHVHIFLRLLSMRDARARCTDAELVRRYRILHPRPTRACPVDADALALILAKGGEEAKLWRRKLLKRMHKLSAFGRELKSRFGKWFNNRMNRCGTLWSGRFRNTLVQMSLGALLTVFSYIELNPIRANLTKRIREFKNSSCAKVLAGDRKALEGWKLLLQLCGIETDNPVDFLCRLLAELATDAPEGKAFLCPSEAEECFELPAKSLEIHRTHPLLDKILRPYPPGSNLFGSTDFRQENLKAQASKLRYKRPPKILPPTTPELPDLGPLSRPRSKI